MSAPRGPLWRLDIADAQGVAIKTGVALTADVMPLLGLVEVVKQQMGLLEPKKIEALSALGLMNSLTDHQDMKNHLGALQALCEDCTLSIEAFKKGAFKDARFLLKSI